MQSAGQSQRFLPEKQVGRRELLKYFGCYTVIFILISLIAFHPFAENETSFVWKIDGIPQYMLWLKYTGSYLRTLIKQLLHGNFTLPMYDFNIGMGSDVRSFFKTEPVEFLGIFLIKDNMTWFFYGLLILLRIYLIGVAFSCYGFYMRKDGSSVLAGTIIYTFSSYTFYHILRHPQFAVGAMLLPLLLIGLEQVIHKKNMLFYTLMVAVSLLSSYYFLFMNTAIMGVYALIRLGDVYDSHRVREFFKMLGRIIVSYLLGCGISAVFFAPSIASFFLSARSSSSTGTTVTQSLLTYGATRIVRLFLTLVAPIRETGSITTISVSVLILPAIILLFSGKLRKKVSLKLGFVVGVIFLMVPVFGYILSGFSAVNNRWSFGFIFVLAVIMMNEFRHFRDITRRQYLVLVALTVLYGIAWRLIEPEKAAYRFAFILLCASVIVLGVYRCFPKISGRAWAVSMMIILSLSVAANGYFIYGSDYGNMVDDFEATESVNTYFTSSRYQHLANIEDDSFYRTDTDMMYNNYNNTAVALGYNGISLYNSTIGSKMIQYFTESESTGISAVNRTLSMDNRTAQEALACVKYFITERGNAQNVPYLFEKDEELSANSNLYDIYTNQNVLSIGYSYTSVMARSDYEALSALEKQQIMLQSAVVDDDVLDAFADLTRNESLSGDVSAGELEITEIDEGIKQDGNVYKVKEKMQTETAIVDGEEETVDTSAKIHFQTSSRAGCEVYLRLAGVRCSRSDRADINVYTDGVDKRAIVRSEEDTYGLGMEDYLINLGYYDEEKTIDGEISFSIKGKYTIEDFEIYYVSLDSYEEHLSDLNEESLQDVAVSTNTVSGTVTATAEQLMTFSIPYHIGWSAYVDGEKVEVYDVNTLYMGIKVSPGTHQIILRYASPGIRVGAVISATCLIVFVILVIFWFRKRRRQMREDNF